MFSLFILMMLSSSSFGSLVDTKLSTALAIGYHDWRRSQVFEAVLASLRLVLEIQEQSPEELSNQVAELMAEVEMRNCQLALKEH
jgi:EAL domain-containing protein (putative c-di-GMP-specific phosphodiesterase class I)